MLRLPDSQQFAVSFFLEPANQLYLIGQLWPISIFLAGSLFYFLWRLFDGIFSTILPDNSFFLKVDSKKHS